ncbi:MAG: adenylate/guanylate cyclase domain-containing protein, partial [Chloroflexi bacterium]|nr:adenylate/guanylate cyclase domain-containing protein [Chloroflexota bacterium]
QLAAADLEQLATEVLGTAVAPGLVKILVERSDGNPFFVEQILFYLREQGLLFADDKGAQDVHTLPDRALPTDVRTLLTARLDRLTQEVKEVVQTAAVLGREFEVAVLAHILREDQALFNKIQAAEKTAIWTSLNELRYLFKHVLLRDAAYEMQLRTRRLLHQLAAEAIEWLHAAELAAATA